MRYKAVLECCHRILEFVFHLANFKRGAQLLHDAQLVHGDDATIDQLQVGPRVHDQGQVHGEECAGGFSAWYGVYAFLVRKFG